MRRFVGTALILVALFRALDRLAHELSRMDR